MGTNDQMIFDNRYASGDLDNDNYLFSGPTTTYPMSTKDEDGNGSQGRRVYLESPSFGNKEEEDMYRYVQSRLTDRTSSIAGTTFPAPTGGTLMDSLDFDLDILGANNARSDIPYRQTAKPMEGTRQLSQMPRSDPRDDPLLGPLLAELDAMSNTQQQSIPPDNYRHNSMPYQSNLVRPVGSSSANHALTNIANRTVNDALYQSELNDSRQRNQQQRSTLPVNQPRPTNMDGTDIFGPSSYTTGPGTFLSHFGPEDQLFQRPLLNNLGQNYVPNPRPLPPPPPPLPPQQQQRDISFDHSQTRLSPPQRASYAAPRTHFNEQPSLPPPPSNPFIEYERAPPQQRYEEKHPPNNQDMFFTDHGDDQQQQQQQQQNSQRQSDIQDQDSRRQAVWNEMQRSNVKAQEKNSKKRESATQNRAPFGSTINWHNSSSQQSSALSKSPQRPAPHHPPPFSKPNHIDENIDMIKNKENFYQRSPARKYENSYSKRKDLHSGGGGGGYEKPESDFRTQPYTTNPQRHSSLPLTINLNTGDHSQGGSSGGTVAIPVDSHVNRVGDKISVNIDLRLVDIENYQQQQQQQAVDHPQWSGGDPLDRHIRKLERNIEQTLPITHSSQRSPPLSTNANNPSMSRYSKQPTNMGRGGYNPPVYGGGDYSLYGDKNREEDSYVAKLNYARKNPQFKPYTGRDYEQFKKNYGFGTGSLGSEFDSTTHKEKSDQLAKTRQYAQQIEARNKKKLSDLSRRTLSDTRLPKAPRPLEYPSSAIRNKQFSGKSSYSSPAILSEAVPFIPARRPTEVLYRPAPLPRPPPIKLPELELPEPVEQEKVPKKSALSARPRQRGGSVGRERPSQRRLSPQRPLPAIVANNKRRPVRFDDLPIPQQIPPAEEQPNTNQNNEELVVVEPS